MRLLPAGFGLRLDPEARCSGDGRTLLGGSPMRLMRLSEHAAKLLAGLRDGAPAESRAARHLGRRLVEAGLAHPAPPPGGPGPGEVTCVVPVRDDADGLAVLLASLVRHEPRPPDVVIVEDGSRHPDAIAAVARDRNVGIIQRGGARGPAAARNEGWRSTNSPIVAFLDADTEVGPNWLVPLLEHFADPTVGAVAPRVRPPAPGTGTLDRFERECSPLDMGPQPSIVGPRRRVPYVPSAALLCRRDALEALDGFDEDLRLGEDVDLIWRAAEGGWTVRYEPAVVVEHRNRRSWAALGRQRFGYGTSAASLAARHPAAAVPLEVAPWSLAAWTGLLLGGRTGTLASLAITADRARVLHRRLVGIGPASSTGSRRGPTGVSTADFFRHGCTSASQHGFASLAGSVRILLRGHLALGRRTATALRRTWLPILLAATASRWGRRLALAALVAEPLASWIGRRPGIGPLRWTAATLLADTTYCAGVWRGAIAARSTKCLRPRLTSTSVGPQQTN